MPPASAVTWQDPARARAFEAWLAGIAPAHGIDPTTLSPASADASFRRYLRVTAGQRSLIVMDAPPPQSSRGFRVQVRGNRRKRVQGSGNEIPAFCANLGRL